MYLFAYNKPHFDSSGILIVPALQPAQCEIRGAVEVFFDKEEFTGLSK